jgi:hypothetical protein
MMTRVHSYLPSTQRLRDIVRRYFEAEHVRYAAA